MLMKPLLSCPDQGVSLTVRMPCACVQRLNRFNKALGMQRSTVGRDPQFDIMSLLRDEVRCHTPQGCQSVSEQQAVSGEHMNDTVRMDLLSSR
jgi:hypothetical protein